MHPAPQVMLPRLYVEIGGGVPSSAGSMPFGLEAALTTGPRHLQIAHEVVALPQRRVISENLRLGKMSERHRLQGLQENCKPVKPKSPELGSVLPRIKHFDW